MDRPDKDRTAWGLLDHGRGRDGPVRIALQIETGLPRLMVSSPADHLSKRPEKFSRARVSRQRVPGCKIWGGRGVGFQSVAMGAAWVHGCNRMGHS